MLGLCHYQNLCIIFIVEMNSIIQIECWHNLTTRDACKHLGNGYRKLMSLCTMYMILKCTRPNLLWGGWNCVNFQIKTNVYYETHTEGIGALKELYTMSAAAATSVHVDGNLYYVASGRLIFDFYHQINKKEVTFHMKSTLQSDGCQKIGCYTAPSM